MSCSDSDSQGESVSGSVTPAEEFPVQPLKESSPESLKDQATPDETSPQEPDSKPPLKDNEITTKDKPEQKTSNGEQRIDIITKKPPISKKQANKTGKRFLKTLRNFTQKEIHSIWFDSHFSSSLWKELV